MATASLVSARIFKHILAPYVIACLATIAALFIRSALNPLLGDDMLLSGLTMVVSQPGAAQQHIHRDYRHLFAEPDVGPGLPVYAVNVGVPLVDVDIQTGPTGIWLGSHRWAPDFSPARSAVTKSQKPYCNSVLCVQDGEQRVQVARRVFPPLGCKSPPGPA